MKTNNAINRIIGISKYFFILAIFIIFLIPSNSFAGSKPKPNIKSGQCTQMTKLNATSYGDFNGEYRVWLPASAQICMSGIDQAGMTTDNIQWMSTDLPRGFGQIVDSVRGCKEKGEWGEPQNLCAAPVSGCTVGEVRVSTECPAGHCRDNPPGMPEPPPGECNDCEPGFAIYPHSSNESGCYHQVCIPDEQNPE